MERNARLYPLYTAAARFHCNAAVFYLFLAEHLSLEELLRLEAIYYVTYVLLEVPSGYFSDRVGRRPTLLVSAAAFVLGFGLMSVGSGFAVFAVAQALLAVGWTFRSGTDTSLHFDSLAGIGRELEYPAREARAARNALLAAAVAALVGGVAGMFSLRLAYVVTFAGSWIPLALVLAMREPRPVGSAPEIPPGFREQLLRCLAQARTPLLAWLGVAFVVIYTVQHVTYTFYQPYLASLVGGAQTTLATGTHAGVTMLAGAAGAAASVRIRDRLGTRRGLLLALAAEGGLVALMAAVLHPLVALLVLLRSAPANVAEVLIHAEVTPRIPRAQRATYLSLQGLAGRLGFSGLLLGLAAFAGKRPAQDIEAVAAMLLGGAAIAGVALLGLALWRVR